MSFGSEKFQGWGGNDESGWGGGERQLLKRSADTQKYAELEKKWKRRRRSLCCGQHPTKKRHFLGV